MKNYQLTYPQKNIWFSEQYVKGTSIWNNVGIVYVDTAEMDLLIKALNLLILSNEGLRIRLCLDGGQPYQYVYKDEESYQPEILYFANKYEVEQFAKKDAKVSMDLIDNQLFDVKICIFDNGIAIYTKLHHIIADGYSCVTFYVNLFEIYQGLIQGKKYDQFYTYLDYLDEEQKYLNSKKYMRNESYWKEKYCDSPEFVYLKPLKEEMDTHSNRLRIVSDMEDSKKIRSFCSENEFSIFNLSIAILTLYISKITQKSDIGLSTTVLNRNNRKWNKVIGMFTNTLPLRFSVNEDMSVNEWLNYIKKEFFTAFRYSKYPFQNILQSFRDEVDQQGNICDVQITYQKGKSYNDDFNIKDYFPEVKQEWFGSGYQFNSFRINIADLDEETSLVFLIDYMTAVYSEEEIQNYYNGFYQLLMKCMSDSSIKLKDLEITSVEEKRMILETFNNTDKEFLKYDNLCDVFQKAVSERPSDVALYFGDDSYEYNTLNQDANKLARILVKKKIGQNDIIPIISERSYEMIVGIYAIIKAGAAYLPISKTMPSDRINYILKDVKSKTVLLQKKNIVNQLEETFDYIDLSQKFYVDESGENLDVDISPNSLAYVIYTSGSTGNPKGVMIEHKSIINRLLWMKDELKLTNQDVLLFKTPYTFDVSVVEMFGWTFSGAKLVILNPNMEKEPKEIYNAIEKYHVTYTHFVPSMLDIFLDYVKLEGNVHRLRTLKNVVASGEALTTIQVRKFKETLFTSNQTSLYNFYGPTEAAVDVSFYKCFTDDVLEQDFIPIGKPIANTKLYVLDKYQKLLPVGVIGELYISGVNVGRGYINDIEKTNDKFLQDIFFEENRMYRTGDLAMFLPDGNIKYIGRNDSQVKIRGYRIELSDIEQQMLNIEEIEAAIVLVNTDENGKKYLIGYYQSFNELNPEKIVDVLKKELPEYMIPYAYVHLNEIPLTSNGKINKKAILSTDMTKIKEKHEMTEASTEYEKILVAIWKDVLQKDEIGITDDFFYKGGDSIKAIQVIFALQKQNMKLNVKDFFECRTIQKLVDRIVLDDIVISQENIFGETNLSPIQKYYFEQGYVRYDCFNQYVVYESKQLLDEKLLKEAVSIVMKEHDCFRMRFRENAGSIEAFYHDSFENLFYFDIESCSSTLIDTYVDELSNKLIQFDLENGPLCKFILIKNENEMRLLAICHHLIIDGISWHVLMKDISDVYSLLEKSEDMSNIEFREKTHSYHYYTENLDFLIPENEMEDEIDYWSHEQNENDKFSFECENTMKPNMVEKNVLFDVENTQKLTEIVNSLPDTSMEELLLLITMMVLIKYSENPYFTIMIESNGRNISENMNLNGTIGWFTAIYPIKSFSQESSMKEKITEIRKKMKRAKESDIRYGILKYIKNLLPKTERPKICFNFFGEISGNGNDLLKMKSEFIGLQMHENKEERYLLEINSFVNKGQVILKIFYNKTKIADQMIDSIEANFRNECLELVNEFRSKENEFIVSTDFDSTNLGEDELEDILGILDDLE